MRWIIPDSTTVASQQELNTKLMGKNFQWFAMQFPQKTSGYVEYEPNISWLNNLRSLCPSTTPPLPYSSFPA